MKVLKTWIAILALIFPYAAGADKIEFGKSSIQPLEQRGDVRWYALSDRGSGRVYKMPTQSDQMRFWISPTIGLPGSHALGVGFANYDGCKARQRGEIELRSSRMDQEVYHAFSVYIHPSSKPLRGTPIFTQIWQNHDTSSPKHPPFSLAFSEKDYHWIVQTSKSGASTKGDFQQVYRSPQALQKGRWYRFVVRFKPSVTSAGAFTVWLDGVPVASQSHKRNFGYAVTNMSPVVRDEFTTRIGAYRGRQKCPTTTADNYNEMYVLFDGVRYGSSLAEVE